MKRFVYGLIAASVIGLLCVGAYRVDNDDGVVIGGNLSLASGTAINEFSTDDTFAGDSDDAVPSEQAVKAYVDSKCGTGTLQFVFDGGGSAITTGAKGWTRLGYGVTLTGWEFTCQPSGSIVVDLWGDVLGNFPPDNGDAMPGEGKEPTITTAVSASDADIADWSDVTWAAGTYVRANVDSAATCTYAVLTVFFAKD